MTGTGTQSRRDDPILSLSGVFTDIAQYHILQGVDLEVPRGGVTMLLGRNGVGKTTTLRTIMGLWRARKGTIRFDSADITAAPTNAIARAGLAHVPENMGIFANLTVEENMILAARARPAGRGTARRGLHRLSAAADFLAVRGGKSVRRSEADARHRPRHGGGAAPLPDRRADQRPRTGNRRARWPRPCGRSRPAGPRS